MQTKTIFKLISASLISLILTACGGGGNGSALENTLNGSPSSSSSSSAGSNATSSLSTSAPGADTLNSIEFKNASPLVINIKGIGGTEASLVSFRTVGKTGLPIKGIPVDFELNTSVGGLDLTQTSGVSDENGIISTSVVSGTISTSVKVTATAHDEASISAQSNQLVIATGLPDQKSMSLSAEKFNPAAWRYNNNTSTITVLLADAYNNPIADGTAVSFTAEGGAIDPSCPTSGGGCSVKWKSQEPRPKRTSSDDSISRILCIGEEITDLQTHHTCEAERAGRITISATAIGNESFIDTDGNGIFNLNVDLFKTSTDGKCRPNVPTSSYENSPSACDDLSEAYLDKNESGTRDEEDPFINFVSDKTHDADPKNNYSSNNGLYNGTFCQPGDEASGLCSRKSITIRKDIVIVMSCDYALLDDDGYLPGLENNKYALADCNGNSLPVGTKITVGANPEFTLGNAISWMTISAPPGTEVKLDVPIDDAGKATVKSSYLTKPNNP